MSACEATSGCYELYSIGSAKFLREIFNSVAMITGSGDFLGACVVAIMLGVILAVIKGIMTGGGKIEVGAIVVSSLVTCIMFVPRATVVVEDVYNGSTYAVDNVPIGVAAPGMFISRVGFTIAELMDQGFSTVDTNFGITNRPFLESTKILSNLRNPQFANSVWDQLGKHTNSDVKRSFYNFFKECTMLKYNFDKTKSVDQDQKMTLENLMDDFQSNVFYTEIYVDGKAVTKTCNDANAILKSKINQLNGDLVNNAMPAPKEYGSNTATEMTDAISMLRLTSADAMEMVKLSIVQPVYDKALAGYFDNSGDVVAALTINNAIQQRNAQWSMEQSLFLNTVRPIITFFEGFVYAVTPFMAILICMGAFGLGIAIKYFQTLIWIQLWMPILAIINLYIYMSAQGAVDSAGIVDKHIDSFYALGTLAQTVETWTSVGGMLAAMTPVIAFFIVAGSAYTFTSIASKLNGADHIDEKAMSPDVLKQAPMFANSKGTYEGTNFGQIATGASDPSISMRQVASIMEQSAREKMVEAQRAYRKEVDEARSITERAGNTEQFDKTYGDGTIYSNGTTYQTGKNQNSAVSFSAGQGFDNVHSEARSDVADIGGRLQATVGAMIGYMLGKNKNGNKSESSSGLTGGVEGKVQGSVDGGFRRSFTDTDSTSNKNTFGKGIQDNISKVANKVNSLGKNRNVNKNNSYGTSQNYAQTLGSDRLARLNKSRSDAIKATEQYHNVQARTQSVDTSQNLTAKAAVQAIGNNGDWSGLRKLIQNNNLGEIYNQKKAFLENQLRYSSDVAEKSALLLTAMESQNADCNNKAATMLGTAIGYQIPQPDSAKNKNIHDLEPNPNNVPSDNDINSTYDNWMKLVDGGILSRKYNIDEEGKAVKDAYGTKESEYGGLVNAEQKFKQFGNDINSIWKDAVMSISNVLKSNQGRHDFNETELLEDQEYLKSSFINSLGSSGISNIDENTKNKLFQLYTMGNAVNFSDNDIKKFVDLYTDAGIDNTAASQIIDTLRNSSGFQAGELTEDVEKNNAARYALFSALNAAKGQQAKYLREHKGDYDEIVKGFSINNGNPTEIANLNSN